MYAKLFITRLTDPASSQVEQNKENVEELSQQNLNLKILQRHPSSDLQ